MTTRARLAGATAAALAASALLAGPAFAAGRPAATPHHAGTPVFAQTDNPDGNTVVVYDTAADGTLSRAGAYATGGLGGVLGGSAVDHLASQGSLTYDRAHGLLYAVNAGSDTVTVFAVRGDRLARLQVIGSGGAFPVSVTVHGDLVYVLNARDGGSVQGFLRLGGTLVRVPSWHRGLGLDPTQTPEFTSTPGQVVFAPDGSALVVTTKNGGNGVDVFGIDAFGRPAATPVVNALPGAVPFGAVFDGRGRLALTEAGPNVVATFTLARDGRLTPVAQAATGQAATCWVAADGDRIYAANAGSGSLSGYVDTDGKLGALGDTATDPGTVDVAVGDDGRYLYAQTGATGTIDEFAVHADGSLTRIGAVTVPGAVGGEGIAAG